MISLTPLSPIFFQIGPIQFHYYGLMYALGFLFAYYLLPHLLRIRNINLSNTIFDNIFFYTFLSGIIGARIFYILFYNFSYYLENPIKIIAFWEGGMASHGGFLGSLIGIYFLSRYYSLSVLKLTDTIVIPLGIGLMLGRFGNFINGELYGRVTNVPWCMEFSKADDCRHPSQLYSAGKDLFLFIVLFSLRKTTFIPGTLTYIFILCYSILRFTVEFFREPDPQIGLLTLNFSLGQWISGIIILISSLLYYFALKKSKK